ncbi:GNAT family N-acetyltransferase [Limnohabitans sp. WS1]|uniref:GNAT family N-acetyltransferase n=1 Tax=Limnohabitans sp. WS1 TaxID=1100726 RepID=UPI000D3886DD|nr:GNAT family N-acetyltransferase [Limnohabitans sp. WS1]PUE18810.1 GNAT family N-acetyltransferase [Limnohabitans sp. WS1]
MDVKWESLSQADWEEFHSSQRGALQQAWIYGEALTSLGVSMARAMVWQDGQLVAIAQFMSKRVLGYISLASCTRGPIFHPDLSPADRAAIYKRLRQSVPVPHLKVPLFSPNCSGEQLDPVETRGMSRVMTGYSTVLLDLTQALSTLKAQLEGKWRNRLNKVLANVKLQVHVQASLKRCDWLLGQELAQREAKKFHGLPTDFVKAYIACAADHRQAFVVAYAELGKNTVGGMLFLIHGRVASYHVGWSDEEGRRLNAHNALLWQAMAYLKDMGIEVLDLGGVNTHDLPGISRFKLGAGGQPITLAGTYF